MTEEDEAFNEIERRSKVKQTLIVHKSKEAMLMAKVTEYEALIRDLTDALRAQKTWVGLTDEEIDELHGSPMELEHSGALKWVRIIEAKLKEKNT